jgi:hypothetical protein
VRRRKIHKNQGFQLSIELASTLQIRARGRHGPTTKARRQRCPISLPGISEFVVLVALMQCARATTLR